MSYQRPRMPRPPPVAAVTPRTIPIGGIVSSAAQTRLRQALDEVPNGETALGPMSRQDVAAQSDTARHPPARVPPMPRNDSMCKETRRLLPVVAYRAQILSAINHRRVVVIEGQTGCGKTTQVCSHEQSFVLCILRSLLHSPGRAAPRAGSTIRDRRCSGKGHAVQHNLHTTAAHLRHISCRARGGRAWRAMW